MSSLPFDSWFATDSHLSGHILPSPYDSSLSSPSPNLSNNNTESPMSSSERLKKPQDSANASGTSSSRTRNNGPEKLSAQASAGFGTSKVSKKRSRASTKAPITVLSADTANFRAMVQKLTGTPGSPMGARNGYHFWDSPSAAASILKPQASRPPSQTVHGLPTLDTSAFLLLDGASSLNQNNKLLRGDSFLRRFPGLSPLLQTSQPLAGDLVQGLDNFPWENASDFRALFSNSFAEQGTHNLMPQSWDLFEGSNIRNEIGMLNQENMKGASAKNNLDGSLDIEQFKTRQTAALESFLMSNEKVDFNSSARSLHSSSVDSWLSPKVELAHSA